MFLSIIIPTCNRNDLLCLCLDKLKHGVQGLSENDYEIIVTDDSKTNQAKVLIEEKYPWVKWTEGLKKGPAANRNNGAKYAKGEWLVFTDDDCLPDVNWLKNYKNAIEYYQNISVFEGSTKADRLRERFDEEAPINESGNLFWSCNFAIKKNLFFLLRGFDEQFPYAAMEDKDFQIRVLEVAEIKFIPDAVVIHPWRRIKPFVNLKKHLLSHQYFVKKNKIGKSFNYRWSRIKIFIGGFFIDFKLLSKFYFKGLMVFVEKIVFNFLMIFA